ncbi:MAG: peroxidase-related enzyme [Pseudomonadota bacterium]|nr:peroxidase-related enzyme [Pseudomonadota bacterium]
MFWIDTVAYDDADAQLRKLYDRVKGPGTNVDTIMMMHSLRPHTMEGHMTLYKVVLHHSANTVPKWFLETIGVWVSLLNRCDYCVDHHFAGLARLLGDEDRATAIGAALGQGVIDACPVEDKEKRALRYAETLTRTPSSVTEAMVQKLRDAGYDDGEILEINQVTAYFNYANRTVLGLGCTTDGDELGLSPGQSGDPDNWTHT